MKFSFRRALTIDPDDKCKENHLSSDGRFSQWIVTRWLCSALISVTGWWCLSSRKISSAQCPGPCHTISLNVVFNFLYTMELLCGKSSKAGTSFKNFCTCGNWQTLLKKRQNSASPGSSQTPLFSAEFGDHHFRNEKSKDNWSMNLDQTRWPYPLHSVEQFHRACKPSFIASHNTTRYQGNLQVTERPTNTPSLSYRVLALQLAELPPFSD